METLVSADIARQRMRPLRKRCPIDKQREDCNQPERLPGQGFACGSHKVQNNCAKRGAQMSIPSLQVFDLGLNNQIIHFAIDSVKHPIYRMRELFTARVDSPTSALC